MENFLLLNELSRARGGRCILWEIAGEDARVPGTNFWIRKTKIYSCGK
jgi:hypothetical protein